MFRLRRLFISFLVLCFISSSSTVYAQDFSSNAVNNQKVINGRNQLPKKVITRDVAGMQAELEFYNQNFISAEETLLLLKAKKDRNFALWSSQLGSLYLAKGLKDEARKSLLDSFNLMNDIAAFNNLENKATGLTGAESAKAYKGDPYEKAFNAFYLALLLYDQNDLDNAYAAVQSGILADSDVAGDLYKSDMAPLYLLASRIEKERGNASMAEDYYQRAETAFYLSHPLNREAVSDEQVLITLMKEKQAEADKISAKYKKEDPSQQDKGEQDKNNFAAKPEKREMSVSDKKKLDKLNEDIAKLNQDIKRFEEKTQENNRSIDLGVLHEFVNLDNNVLMAIEIGSSPLKYQVGQYGEKAVFAQRPCEIAGVALKIDGATDVSTGRLLDSDVRFQAVTRGGRKMDGILKGKAEFKATTAQLANSFADASRQMSNQANQMAASNPYANTAGLSAAAGAFALVGLAMAIGSEMANPAADARHWSFLPSRCMLFPLKLSVGKHKIDVLAFDRDGKSIDRYTKTWEIEIKDQKTNVGFNRIFERLAQ